MFTLAWYFPGVSVVVRLATSFISAIEPIAGMWNRSDAAPTSTVLPEASAKERVRSLSPLLSSPVALESVMVRSPDFVDLMAFSFADDSDFAPPQAAVITAAMATTRMVTMVLVFIAVL